MIFQNGLRFWFELISHYRAFQNIYKHTIKIIHHFDAQIVFNLTEEWEQQEKQKHQFLNVTKKENRNVFIWLYCYIHRFLCTITKSMLLIIKKQQTITFYDTNIFSVLFYFAHLFRIAEIKSHNASKN